MSKKEECEDRKRFSLRHNMHPRLTDKHGASCPWLVLFSISGFVMSFPGLSLVLFGIPGFVISCPGLGLSLFGFTVLSCFVLF